MTRQQRNNLISQFMIAIVIVVSSELGLNFMLQGFRISLAVVLLPFFLLTLAKKSDALLTAFTTAVAVMGYRSVLHMLKGEELREAAIGNFPAMIFYLSYGALFLWLVRQDISLQKNEGERPMWPKGLWFRLCFCDFGANILEVAVRTGMALQQKSLQFYIYLAVVAAIRTTLCILLVVIYGQYHDLLTRAEHEERYQRLFLMRTALKTELFFMEKSSGKIEETVKNAYHLYEKLNEYELPKEVKQLALNIACDIHDIKKDYIHITKGMREEMGEDREMSMHLSDLVEMLEKSTNLILVQSESDIALEFRVEDDFETACHYQLAAILRCLINNAIEAIQGQVVKSGSGDWSDYPGKRVRIEERLDGDVIEFAVKDNGPGIPAGDLDKIFHMGYSTKYNQLTGDLFRGMGLASVKLYAEEQLGGTVEARSKEGEGSQFIVRIPKEKLWD